MDKDRIAGSAKDFAGKVEGVVGDRWAMPRPRPRAGPKAAGSVQNLYGQAKDAARDAGDAAVNYAKGAYEKSGDTCGTVRKPWRKQFRKIRSARC